MRKVLAIFFIFLTAISCKEEKIRGVIVDTQLDLLVLDNLGANLLQNGGFKPEDIRLFNVVNGVKEEVFLPNQDSPRNFFIYNFENPGIYAGQKLIRIFPNLVEKGDETTTLIQWNAIDVDTIKTQIERIGSSSVLVYGVWINGKLKWNREIGKQQYNSGEMTSLNRFIKLEK